MRNVNISKRVLGPFVELRRGGRVDRNRAIKSASLSKSIVDVASTMTIMREVSINMVLVCRRIVRVIFVRNSEDVWQSFISLPVVQRHLTRGKRERKEEVKQCDAPFAGKNFLSTPLHDTPEKYVTWNGRGENFYYTTP